MINLLTSVMGLIFISLSSYGASMPTSAQCRLAQDVSREFSLSLTNGKISKAYKLWHGGNFKNEVELETYAKKQLRELYGKEMFHSLSTMDGSKVACIKGVNGSKRFVDHRVLLYFDQNLGNGVVRVLPLSIQLEWIKGQWQVHAFSSTAM